jgi:hypothetical protein
MFRLHYRRREIVSVMFHTDVAEGSPAMCQELIMDFPGIGHPHAVAEESDQMENAMNGAVLIDVIKTAMIIISLSPSDNLSQTRPVSWKEFLIGIQLQNPFALCITQGLVAMLAEIVFPGVMIDLGAEAFSDFNRVVCRPGIDDDHLIDILMDALQATPQTGRFVLHNHAQREEVLHMILLSHESACSLAMPECPGNQEDIYPIHRTYPPGLQENNNFRS